MKTTKGGKVMNPTDAYRKELRKKELKRNKKERKKVREVGILKKDPDTLKDQIEKLEMMKADGALDKARKHKKRQLEDTLSLVMKKRKEYEEKMREKGEAPVMFSHLGPPPRRRTSAEEEDRVKHPKAEDSVYFHPTLNPTGAPPPGKPPMYKSSIGPRIPLSESDGGASSSNPESEEGGLSVVLPPPPPPPPLPASNELPPLPPAGDSITKEPLAAHRTLPPPPPIQRPSQPAPPGTESDKVEPERQNLKEPDRATSMLPPPPPPPGFPPKSANHVSETGSSESAASGKDASRMMMPPLLPPPPPLLHRPPSLQSDMMPIGMARFPPPPPPPLDMRPPLMEPGRPPPPPGVIVQGIPRPPFPGLMRPPVLVGLPPMQEDDLAPVPQKPSYVKSAASTVVKRPLAQHNPELTSMVPASVRVRRESAAPKGKPKAQPVAAPRPALAAGRSEMATASTAAKAPSIDESYMAFLEDMKSLGALEN